MSKITRGLLCVALLSCLALPAAQAQNPDANIVVTQAWSRATPGGSKVAGGYLTVENKGSAPDRLLSASTKAAKKIEVHQMAVNEGVMTMRPVEGGLSIEPGRTVKFAPGGLHLMIIGLSAPLVQGDKVPVALKFEKAGEITVSFDVRAMGAPAPGPLGNATDPAAHAELALKAAPAPANNDFFIHLHDQRAMANVTIYAVHDGAVVISIQLETVEELPLKAEGVAVTLGNPDKGVAPVTAQAQRTADDQWTVKMPASNAGRWNLGLGITLAPAAIVGIESPILIY
jgi:copper(I)-binding protein